MDGAGDELLAGPPLPLNEDGPRDARDALDELDDAPGRRRTAHDLEGQGDRLPELAVLLQEAQRALELGNERGDPSDEGAAEDEEVAGPRGDCPLRAFDVARLCHQHHGDARMPLTELLDDGVAYQFSVAQISTMPFEEIHTNPEAFAQTVQKLTAEDLANMGIQVVSFTIREIQDPSGYMTALGRPKLADVQKNAALGEASAHRDAAMGQAHAERESAVARAAARRESELAQLATEVAVLDATAERDKRLAEMSSEVSEKKAESDLSYELSANKTRQLILRERLLVRDLEIVARERELIETVQKPAEAERQRIETLALAERTRARVVAEGEAEAARLIGQASADVKLANGRAEVEFVREKAFAEAEGLQRRLEAEAEGMRKHPDPERRRGAERREPRQAHRDAPGAGARS